MYPWSIIELHGYDSTRNNLSRHRVLYEEFIIVMKFKLFTKHQKRVDRKKDQVLQLGRQ